eukprot:IDg9528t1
MDTVPTQRRTRDAMKLMTVRSSGEFRSNEDDLDDTSVDISSGGSSGSEKALNGDGNEVATSESKRKRSVDAPVGCKAEKKRRRKKSTGCSEIYRTE